MSVYKRLVFHFYADKKYKENRAVQIHLNCLRYYHDVFDEALFRIAVDDIADKELIENIETEIIKCGFKNLHLKVVKNDVYREARTFYEEIVLKMSVLDGITFFGHTKGYTNYIRMPNGATIDSLDTWLTGMYYLSLNNIEDVECNLLGQPYFNNFYGSFLSYCEKDCYGTDFILYSGTFFWINCLQLSKEEFWKVPLLDNLAYAERFPSNFYKLGDFSKKTSHRYGSYGDYLAFCTNYYYFASDKIKDFLYTEENYNKFIEYKKNMIKNA